MTALRDLTGMKFVRLTVISRAPNTPNNRSGNTAWNCVCDCGTACVVAAAYLTRGGTGSCGCLAREQASERNRIHGGFGTSLYMRWHDMIRRCEKPTNPNFHNYGERGITVCPEWRHSFEAFRDWALENGYDVSLTLDRIDVNGNYEPGNCRWATDREQNLNRRDTRFCTLDGETRPLQEWAEKYGIQPNTVKYRLKLGWDEKRALTTPVRRRSA